MPPQRVMASFAAAAVRNRRPAADAYLDSKRLPVNPLSSRKRFDPSSLTRTGRWVRKDCGSVFATSAFVSREALVSVASGEVPPDV
jgi:hypothetical protein